MARRGLNVAVPDTAEQIFFSLPPYSPPCLGFVSSHYWFGTIPPSFEGPLSPKYSHLFSAIYSSSAFSSTRFSRVSPSPPALANVGNISSLTGPHSDTQTAVPSRSPPRGLPRQRGRGEKIQSTVSALFGLLNTDLTSVNRGTDDI